MEDPNFRDQTGEIDLQSIADAILARGMEIPAVFLLEAHRPLRGILFQLSVASGPLLSIFTGGGGVRRLQKVLENPELVDRLLSLLEIGRDRPVAKRKETSA